MDKTKCSRLISLIRKEISESWPVMRQIVRFFSLAEIAEKEIEAAMLRYPDSAELIWNQFGLLMPQEHFYSRITALYRHHCRELLDRVAAKEPLDVGTVAEVLCTVVDASYKAPLTYDAAILYYRLFKQILPNTDCQPIDRESFDGAVDIMYNGMAKRIGTISGRPRYATMPEVKEKQSKLF